MRVMSVLLIGLVLFVSAHSVRIVVPRWRDAMIARVGEGPWKGLYAIASLGGLMLVGRGWTEAGAAPAASLYEPISGAGTLAAIAMPIFLVLLVAGNLPPGRIRRTVRHPMLVATIGWGVIHLLANGESRAVLLFGALAAWALADLVSVLARDRAPEAAPVALGPHAAKPSAEGGPPAASALWPDVAAVIVGLALYAWLILHGHAWLFGVAPMG